MYALIDCRMHEAALGTLQNNGFTTILIPPAEYLEKPVASHPDMLLFIGFGRLFCHAKYYKDNKSIIDRIIYLSNLKLTLSDEKTDKKYPLDVLFNACAIGNKLICNEKTISKLILNAAKEHGFKIINVPQGYTKCSICQVSENAIITSDKTIAETSAKNSIEVLFISEGHISLPPYDYGFIGGASGLCGKTVYFCGSLDKHPEGEKIKSFCIQNGAKAVCLSDYILQDVGTIFFT